MNGKINSGKKNAQSAEDVAFQRALGARIKKIREDRQWSQESLAAFANVGVNQISRIENGRHAVGLHTLKLLAKALGKYPYELLKFDFQLDLNTDFSEKHKMAQSPETTSTLNNLVATNFLNSPKSVKEITNYCRKVFKVNLKSSATSGGLRKLVTNGYLKRLKAEASGRYLYQKRLKAKSSRIH